MTDRPPAAVFLSYASQDGEAVRRIAEALRAAGVEVWFDLDELRGGDEWDRKIKNQIRTCALFVPVISANTQARPEGYFRLEWHLAEQRSLLIAKGRAFIVPVCIDETKEGEALVPDAFLAVQWSRPSSDAKLTQFVAQAQRLLAGSSGVGRGLPTPPFGRAAGSGDPALQNSPPAIPDYELLRQIGRGSYGDVWLARGATGLWRAVKIVWRDRFADAEPFEREWRGLKEFAAISLGESSHMALLHIGRNDAAGFFFYVMELADDAERGRAIDPAVYMPLTLTEVRKRRHRLPAAECMRIGADIARTLAKLHGRGLVHRDIKPSNAILVDGAPKLADIGLVAPASSAQTFVGTEGFVPPEGPGSSGADVFALGKVLYELSTGLDRQDFPQLPSELSRLPDHRALLALNEVILRACEANPEKRYRDAAALLADLETLRAGKSVRRASRWPLAAAASVAVLLAAALLWRWWPRAAGPAPTAQSVAVLPFANLSGDQEQEYFSDGLTEEILNALARERDLRVPGRTSAFAFKGKKLAAAEIARALNVAQLVEGSVQPAGSRVRIRVSLTRASDGFSEPLGTFDGEVKDIFALQDEVARKVVEKLTRRTATRGVAVLTKNAAAYDAYLRGRALQMRAAGDNPAAAKLYEQAVALDPAFALAWARLSQARFRGYGGMNDRSPAVVDSSREAVDRALALQPDLPEALIARSHWLRAAASDFAAAQRDLARAEALQPATAELRFAQCTLARDMGDWPEAMRRARESIALDPQNGDAINAIAITIFAPRGDYAEADRLYAQAMAIQGAGNLLPFRNRVILRTVWRGPEAALRLIERAPDGQAGKENLRARVLRLLGRTDEAREIGDKLPATTGPVASFQGRNDGEVGRLVEEGRGAEARTRSEEIRADALREFARGNHGPLVRLPYLQAELTLGHRDEALAVLNQWRRDAQRLPGTYRRIYEFNLMAGDFYTRLGQPEETKTLLREILVHGFQPVFSFRPDLAFTDWRSDPAFGELAKAAAAWSAAQPDPTDEPPTPPAPAAAPAPANGKSLVVLPLENLSPDPADAFFTEGMHEEIIQTLARLGGLEVRSRSTALTLKGTKAPLAAIGQQMAVSHVLSGSLQRRGKDVRVTLELRKTADEGLVWQRRFQQEFKDGFALQDEIAAEVAKVLQVHTSTGWFAGAKFMTKNAEAYELFLKARDLPAEKGPGVTTFREQAELGERAMALDPDFMAGASLLSQAYTYLYSSSRSTLGPAERADIAARAKRWGERASALMPGAGDGALAVYYSMAERDPEQALVYAQNEVRALPNDPNGYNRLGIVANWGRFREALESYNRALALDPMHARALYNRVRIAAYVRDLPAFEEAAAKSLEHGGRNINRYEVFEYRFNLTGKLPDGLFRYPDNPTGDAMLLWLGRRFQELLDEADRVAREDSRFNVRFSALVYRARAAEWLGRKALTAETAATLLAIVEKEAVAAGWPEQQVQSMKVTALTFAGRKAEAVGICRRLLEGLAAPVRTSDRWGRELDLALIHAWFGDKRECVEILARLILVPSGVTVPNLRLAPDWDRVRDDPGFQALLADPRNSAPL